ncbi:MAG: hypothetical protein ABH881_02145 [bacterium]
MNFFSKILNSFYLSRENYKEYVLEVFSYLDIKIYVSLFLIINIVSWILAKSIIHLVDAEQIALHYNVDFGIDYYGNTSNIYIIPLLGLIIFLINFVLYAGIGIRHKARRFFSHVLFSVAIVSNYILLTAILLIYLVNFK